ESFFSLLQNNVLDRRSWATRDELRAAIVHWIERTYHRRRRQERLGRLTPVEFETIMTLEAPQAAGLTLSPNRASAPNYRPEICKSCDRDTFPFSSCSSTSSWWEAAGDPPHLSPNAARTVTSGDCAVLTS